MFVFQVMVVVLMKERTLNISNERNLMVNTMKWVPASMPDFVFLKASVKVWRLQFRLGAFFKLFFFPTVAVWSEKEKVSRKIQQHIFLKRNREERSQKRWGGRGGRRWRRGWWCFQIQIGRKWGICFIVTVHSNGQITASIESPFVGRRWRGRRWRLVKIWPGRQRWGRWQSSQEKGQPLQFLALLLALFQLQFSVQVQVKGQRSRVTPGKMSVSAQSSSGSSTSLMCPVTLCLLVSGLVVEGLHMWPSLFI